MKSSFKKLPGSKIALEVQLDQKEFLEYFERSFTNALSQVEVKGFRKGTAPREIAEHGVDREKVFNDAALKAVKKSLHEVQEDNGWVVIDQPQVEILDASSKKSIGLSYKVELTVFPEVALGDYQKIAKKILAEKKPTLVEEEEIEKALGWLQDSRASIVRAEREAKEGDVVEVDVKSEESGKPIPGADLRGDKFILGKSNFMPGFDAQIIGKKAGEQFSFSLTAPVDYWQKDLQNKTIDFTVKLHGVFQRTVPPLDAAFAAGLGTQFKTIDDVRKSIREGMTVEREEKEMERIHLKIVKAIADHAKIDIPQIMVERTIDMMIENVKAMAPKLEKSPEELRKELQERARDNVAHHLVLQAIAKQEQLEPTPEEIEEEARHRNLDPQQAREYSYSAVQSKKVFSFLDSLT